jgi:cholesterol oxidase
VFEDGWPVAITRAGLEPWYDMTEAALEPVTTPDQPDLPKLRAFDAVGAHAGRTAERLPIAVHFGEEREHPFSGVRQGGCENLGRCDIGCPVRAKNTVDITYLARAEQLGAEVRPLHLVTKIEPGWKVAFKRLGGGGEGTVEAERVVLAAGTLGSTRLLLQNRKALPGLSPALGTRFSGNGDALAVAFDPGAPDVQGARNGYGPVMTSRLDYIAERGLMAADGGLPVGFDALLDVARDVDVIRGWRRWLLRLRNWLVHLGWGDRSLKPRELRLRERRSEQDALIYLLIGRDAADGRMQLSPLFRKFEIRWSKAGSAQLFADLETTARELAEVADATPFYALEGGPLSTFTTVHPLGGCPMADNPAHGVVDDVGRVYGEPGLYVLDGSIVPTSLGVNPSKTIAALAERGAAALVEELA